MSEGAGPYWHSLLQCKLPSILPLIVSISRRAESCSLSHYVNEFDSNRESRTAARLLGCSSGIRSLEDVAQNSCAWLQVPRVFKIIACRRWKWMTRESRRGTRRQRLMQLVRGGDRVKMLLLQLLRLHSLTLSPSSSVFSDSAFPLRNNKRTIMDMKETRRQR